MSDTMKKKPSRTKRTLRVVKPEPALHAHHSSSSDLQQMIRDIQEMTRKDLRTELREEHGIDPDVAVKRIQSSVNEVLRTVRRKLHRPNEEEVANTSSC